LLLALKLTVPVTWPSSKSHVTVPVAFSAGAGAADAQQSEDDEEHPQARRAK
jgi:hypothetical protein